MKKETLIERLKALGIEVVGDKVRKDDLERVLAANITRPPKMESSKDGYYEFSLTITEDYSQVFLSDTKNMSEDDAYEYYDSQEYLGNDEEDKVWDAVRRLYSDVTAESIKVEGSIFNLTPIPDAEWTKEKAADALKTLTLQYRVSFRYELSAESRVKLENAAAEALKKHVEV